MTAALSSTAVLVFHACRPNINDYALMGALHEHREVTAFFLVAERRHADLQAVHRLRLESSRAVRTQTGVQRRGGRWERRALAVGAVDDGVFHGRRNGLKTQLVATDSQAMIDDPATGIRVVGIDQEAVLLSAASRSVHPRFPHRCPSRQGFRG